MMRYTIDISRVRTKTGLHRVLSHALPLPAYYGKNLDALYDVLTEPHELWELNIVGVEKAKSHLGEYADSFFQTLSDAATDGAALTVTVDSQIDGTKQKMPIE